MSLAELAAAEGLDIADHRLAMTLELAEEMLASRATPPPMSAASSSPRGPLTELAVVTNAAWRAAPSSNGTKTTSTRSAS
jgi:error-prone DNA polymerase